MDANTKFERVAIHCRVLKSDEDRAGNWSGYRRLKGILKRLLRSYGFRCERLTFDEGETQEVKEHDE